MIDFYQASLSCFGREARMTDEQLTRLHMAVLAYRGAKERYEITVYEADDPTVTDEIAYADYCQARRDLGRVRAELMLELAQTLAKELRDA